jgi:hypothetical protein
LNGPRHPSPKCYKQHKMQDVFMRTERTLAHALTTAVFCKEVPYGGSPISFIEVHVRFEFDTDTAFRCTTLMFHAENESEKDLYRITIEGTGNDLSMHRFTFEPSLTWLCRRYPDNSRRPALTASTGGALGSNSNSGSDVPPQQVAVVSGKPAAGTCDGGGGGGGGGGPRLSASEALVRDLQSKSEFLSDSGDLYRCVVQKPTARPYKKDSKSFQKQRAAARLAATARPQIRIGGSSTTVRRRRPPWGAPPLVSATPVTATTIFPRSAAAVSLLRWQYPTYRSLSYT